MSAKVEPGQVGEGARVRSLDALVVGAGFSGLYMLHKLREQGLEVQVYEAGSGLGGTWFWNRYPGARCDIPSLEYSYQFSEALQQEWSWSERYATQSEILRYAEHVADRFDLRSNIEFNARVQSAHYDQAAACWTVTIQREGGTHAASEGASTEIVSARHVVMATGCLSVVNSPNIKGLEDFSGDVYHTGHWPHEGVDFSGKRVAVIGTGSSAIQSIPHIAEQATQLTVFQRTPNYSIPAHNGPLDPAYVADIKSRYREFRAENWTRGFGADFGDREVSAMSVDEATRNSEYEARWQRGGLAFLAAFDDLVFDDAANATAREFFARKIADAVGDEALADILTPSTPIGCKRLCVDTNYYQTYQRDNVTLVDLQATPIEEVTASHLHTSTTQYEFDTIVLATGFDAMTGAVSKIDITGIDGVRLQDKWSAGPRAYLGLATAGFPNLFLITGPGSPSVLSNMLPSIEHHVEWVADCIAYMQDNQVRAIQPEVAAEDAWVAHVNEVASGSVYPDCNSWYLGANVEGKERVFMPYLGVPPYIEKCAEVVADDYAGFVKDHAN